MFRGEKYHKEDPAPVRIEFRYADPICICFHQATLCRGGFATKINSGLVAALESPDLVGSENIGITFNVGNFDGNTALGFAAASVFSRDAFGTGARAAITAGVGWRLVHGTVAAKGGLQFTW